MSGMNMSGMSNNQAMSAMMQNFTNNNNNNPLMDNTGNNVSHASPHLNQNLFNNPQAARAAAAAQFNQQRLNPNAGGNGAGGGGPGAGAGGQMNVPQQLMPNQQLPHLQNQRPSFQRSNTQQTQPPQQQQQQQQQNGKQFQPMSAPSGQFPTSNNPSAGNSTGHTPQISSQPQPQPQLQSQMPPQLQRGSVLSTQGPKINATPILAHQQQPTPQVQPRGPPIIQAQSPSTAPAPGHIPNPGAAPKPADQFQNELNAKIFKRNLGNAGAIRILDLIDQVSSDDIEFLSNIDYWQRIVQIYFIPTSILRFTTSSTQPPFASQQNQDSGYLGSAFANTRPGAPRQFELTTATAPRFFLSNILGGNLARFHISLPGLKFQVMNNGSIFIASKLNIQYYYLDGSSSTVHGTVKLLMSREFRFEWIDCHCLNYQSNISFIGLEKLWAQFINSSNKPRGKVNGKDDENKRQQEFFLYLYENSESVKYSQNSGISEQAMRVMQVGDTMSHLRSLMAFSVVNNIGSPLKAMELFMARSNNQRASISNGAPRVGPNGMIPTNQSTGNGTINGSTSSPSPHTLTNPNDPKATVGKKRKMSSSSLLGMENKQLGKLQRKK